MGLTSLEIMQAARLKVILRKYYCTAVVYNQILQYNTV